jgi:tetratricopeptide (TPR) repeat protein
VEALEAHLQQSGEEPDPFVWFDLCCNSQHDTSERPMEWWKTTFLEAIRDIGRTVMIMEPWEDPIPLTRAWCIWEVLCTCQTKAKFEIAMTKPQRERFISALNNEYGSIMKMVCRIDCRRAEAWKESDRVGIMECVESTIGFVQMNAVVVSCIRTWILGMAKLEIGAFQKRSYLREAELATPAGVAGMSASAKATKVNQVVPVTEQQRGHDLVKAALVADAHAHPTSSKRQQSHASIDCNFTAGQDENTPLMAAADKDASEEREIDFLNDPLATDLAVETVKLLRDQNQLKEALSLGEECLKVRTVFASRRANDLPARYLEKTTDLMIVLADIVYEQMDVERAIVLIDGALAIHESVPTAREIDRLDILFCQLATKINLGRNGGTWLFMKWLYRFRKMGKDRWKVFISDSARRPGLMFMARNFMGGMRMQYDFERHLEIPRGKPRFMKVFEAFLQVVTEEYGSVHPTTLLGAMVVSRELVKLNTPQSLARAETMMKATVDGALVTMGKGRHEVVSAMMGLADCYEVQERHAEALATYQRAVEACKHVHPARSPFLCLCGVARSQRALHDLTASLATLAEAEKLVEKYPPQHPLVTALRRSRAYTLDAMAHRSVHPLKPQISDQQRVELLQEAQRLHLANRKKVRYLQNFFVDFMNGILFASLGAPS